MESYKLLDRFDKVMEIHKQVRENNIRQQNSVVPELYRNTVDNMGPPQSKITNSSMVVNTPTKNNGLTATAPNVVKKEPNSPGGRSATSDISASGSEFSRGSGLVLEKNFSGRGGEGPDLSLKMK